MSDPVRRCKFGLSGRELEFSENRKVTFEFGARCPPPPSLPKRPGGLGMGLCRPSQHGLSNAVVSVVIAPPDAEIGHLRSIKAQR